jgi:hypothetical protein
VQTLWAEKIQSTTDAGSLNTFGRNEIEVDAYLIGTSSHCVFSNTIQNLPCSEPRTRSRWVYQYGYELAFDYLSKMKIAMMMRQLDLGHDWTREELMAVLDRHRKQDDAKPTAPSTESLN